MVKDVFVSGDGGWIGAVARLGVPVVLALGLTYFLVARVETTQALIVSNQSAIIATQALIIGTLAEAKGTMNLFSVEQRRDTRVMTALLLQTCLNTARPGTDQQTACHGALSSK